MGMTPCWLADPPDHAIPLGCGHLSQTPRINEPEPVVHGATLTVGSARVAPTLQRTGGGASTTFAPPWSWICMRPWLPILGIAIAVGATAPAPAQARVEFGVVFQELLSEQDFERMGRGGVETLRFVLRREAVETAPSVYDWSGIDPIATWAASERIDLLPIVYGSPAWVHETEAHPPIDSAADRRGWKRFLTELIDRYGPRGEFWRSDLGLSHPIRRWQIWNEGNFDFYWIPRPTPASTRVWSRLRRRDPPRGRGRGDRPGRRRLGAERGQVVEVHGGPVRDGPESSATSTPLRSPLLPRVTSARRPDPADARGDAQGRRRPHTPGNHRDRLGLRRRSPAPLVVGEEGQARLLRRSFAYLEGHRREWLISDVQWYAWQDSLAVEAFCSFCEHAGLFDLDGEAKPAWRAFQRATG